MLPYILFAVVATAGCIFRYRSQTPGIYTDSTFQALGESVRCLQRDEVLEYSNQIKAFVSGKNEAMRVWYGAHALRVCLTEEPMVCCDSGYCAANTEGKPKYFAGCTDLSQNLLTVSKHWPPACTAKYHHMASCVAEGSSARADYALTAGWRRTLLYETCNLIAFRAFGARKESDNKVLLTKGGICYELYKHFGLSAPILR